MTEKIAVPPRLIKPSRAIAVALSVLLGVGGALAAEHDDVDALIQSRKYDEALARADKFLSSKPRDVQMRFLKGVAQLESNRRAEAITTFTQLTQDAPELPEPHNNLAVLHASQGNYDRARTALEAALRTNPSYATAQENLGDVYARLAGDAYSQALQLGQNNSAVAPKLAVIRSVFPTAGASGAPEATKLAAASASGSATGAPAASRPVPSAPVVAAAPVPAPVAKQVPTPPKPAVAAAPVTPPPVPKPAVQPPAAAPAPVERAAPPVVAGAAAAPSAAGAPASAPSAAQTAAVEKSVRDWANAWAEQDMKRYLAAYASNFEVPGGASRASWEEGRRIRIVGKSDIAVQLEQLQISVDGDKAVARFLQRYKADALNVRSRKTLHLIQQGGNWRITREVVGGR